MVWFKLQSPSGEKTVIRNPEGLNEVIKKGKILTANGQIKGEKN